MNPSTPSPEAAPAATTAASPRPAPKVDNRRLQERTGISGRVVISREGQNSPGQRIAARAVDVSKSGILLEAESPVAPGTVVLLQTAGLAYLGKACVRHCVPKGAKYRIGLYVPDRLLRKLNV